MIQRKACLIVPLTCRAAGVLLERATSIRRRPHFRFGARTMGAMRRQWSRGTARAALARSCDGEGRLSPPYFRKSDGDTAQIVATLDRSRRPTSGSVAATRFVIGNVQETGCSSWRGGCDSSRTNVSQPDSNTRQNRLATGLCSGSHPGSAELLRIFYGASGNDGATSEPLEAFCAARPDSGRIAENCRRVASRVFSPHGVLAARLIASWLRAEPQLQSANFSRP
jgi:hypothetical protein